MSRTSFIVMLPPDQQSQVNALIRRYAYVCVDRVKDELAALGIRTSRTALHRYSKRLQAADLRSATGRRETVVIVLDAEGSAPIAIQTPASSASVIGAIGSLGSSNSSRPADAT
ncbi:MAG: DUF3486 family protein [Proteobacteria bacterium]|nr:DUF3486 family protein [Pseudomonadota bacterium]